MNPGDQITGIMKIGEKQVVLRGYGNPSWSEIRDGEEKREDFMICNGKYGEISQGSDVFNLAYGPSTGGLEESVRFNIYTYGERILSIAAEPLYKDRRIVMTGTDPVTALLRVERINGAYSPFYSSLFLTALESIGDAGNDPDLGYARILMNEVARIADHLHVIGRLAEGAAQNVAYHQIFALREDLLRIVSARFGHRYFFGVNGYGGLRRKVNLEGITMDIHRISGQFREIWSKLEESRIFVDRIQTTTTVRKPWLIGPAARGAGFRTDSRISSSGLPYGDLGMQISVSESGDSLSRALVRKDEIAESASIIETVEGLIRHVPDAVDFNGRSFEGEYTTRTEAPGGDAVMRIALSGSRMEAFYLRSPSVQNLAAFCAGIGGNVLTDFTFGFESLGIHISETGGYL